jgi:hypothetical protein
MPTACLRSVSFTGEKLMCHPLMPSCRCMVRFVKSNAVKTATSIFLNRRLAFFLFLTVFAWASCSRKVIFQESPVVPAATGTVKMKRDQNNNYALTVRVANLAEPVRLTPSKKHYIVWLETEDNGVKNIGQLVSSSGLFSKKLKASLEAVTPYKPRRVFITAEYETEIQYPGPQVVLRSNSF